MKLRKIRYDNARLLVAQCGKLKDFAEKLGKAEAQCSSFAGTNPRKGIGDAVAADIERVFGLASGWLDIKRSTEEAAHPDLEVNNDDPPRQQEDFDSYAALIDLGREVQDFKPHEWAEIKAYARLIRARKGGAT